MSEILTRIFGLFNIHSSSQDMEVIEQLAELEYLTTDEALREAKKEWEEENNSHPKAA